MSWSKSYGPGTAEEVIEEVKASEDSSTNDAVHNSLFEEAKNATVARIEAFAKTPTYEEFGVMVASNSGHGDKRNTSYNVSVAIPYDAKPITTGNDN